MNLTILFWFYKEKEICRNRIEQIHACHQDISIYGLYGGNPSKAGDYEAHLKDLLDDFYCTRVNRDEQWKWLNGDLLITDWYANRGKQLSWDSIAVVQWDMLVFDDLRKLLSGIKPGEIFITYYRELTPEIEDIWSWTQPGSPHRPDYLKFKSHVCETFGYQGNLWCCGFILEIFSRQFLKTYAAIKDNEIGFLEYKVPTYANLLGFPFFRKDMGEWWSGNKAYAAINAYGVEISDEYIREQLSISDGFRLFHPYFRLF